MLVGKEFIRVSGLYLNTTSSTNNQDLFPAPGNPAGISPLLSAFIFINLASRLFKFKKIGCTPFIWESSMFLAATSLK